MPPPAHLLVELFEAHGVTTLLTETRLIFPDFSSLWAEAMTFNERKQGEIYTVQLGIRLGIAPGRRVVESFGGVGSNPDEALINAFQGFTVSSFHVFLATFFTPEAYDEQVTYEQWELGSAPRPVILGNLGIKGNFPESTDPTEQFTAFENALKRQNFSPETHWIRLFYGHAGGTTLACEVLLDNEPWPELQEVMRTVAWPPSEEYYSLRVFLVLPAADHNHGTLEHSILTCLLETLQAHPDGSEETLVEAMIARGIVRPTADRAFKFTQLVCGRSILGNLLPKFALDYHFFDAHGTITESGKLADDPLFCLIADALPELMALPSFKTLLIFSSEFNTVNKMLHNGSKPENIQLGPVGFFTEPPTHEGHEKVQTALRQMLEGETPPKTMPWWKKLGRK
ncbi:DUF6348 family protein [Armatimonas sp.]|uniref:DUF6348 family protein n=1 Tax=Armatimonas sp. TaxID=1872638 RepID=UPI00286BECA6|nr:DUF6348 family protein [Armatimonas sp.]